MLDFLYENIGVKIKNWAIWIFIVEAIGAIIIGTILATEEDILYIFIAIGGPIIAWVGSWILYAFGEMVEDIHAMRNAIAPASAQDAIDEAKRQEENNTAIKNAKQQRKAEEKLKKEKARLDEEEEKKEKARLDKEEQFIQENYIDITCPSCGEQLSFLKDETNGFCPECGANFKI